jgi:hypothetical protein
LLDQRPRGARSSPAHSGSFWTEVSAVAKKKAAKKAAKKKVAKKKAKK